METGDDSSGNGFNLNLVGNPSFGPGLFGQALSLTGDPSQYATLSANPSAFNFGASNFTVQLWVNFNTFGGPEQTLIEKLTGGGGAGGWTITTPPDGSNNFIEFGATTTTDSWQEVNAPVVPVSTGVWNQIVAERDGDIVNIYLNDTLIASDTSFTGSIIPSTNPLLIGQRDGHYFPLNGSLDEIAIWNRALSTSEITSLWNNGAGQMIDVSSVPEPSTFMLAAAALLLVGGRGSFVFFSSLVRRRR